MSLREELQNRISAWLLERESTFTAPYGVIAGLHTPASGRGKARVVTFGIARTLDATLFVWSPTRLDLETNRGTYQFKTEQEFYDHCVKEYGAPK